MESCKDDSSHTPNQVKSETVCTVCGRTFTKVVIQHLCKPQLQLHEEVEDLKPSKSSSYLRRKRRFQKGQL